VIARLAMLTKAIYRLAGSGRVTAVLITRYKNETAGIRTQDLRIKRAGQPSFYPSAILRLAVFPEEY
jgi:hypothetical protein